MIENSDFEEEFLDFLEEVEDIEPLQWFPRGKRLRKRIGRLYIAS